MPALFGLTVSELNLLVDRRIASFSPGGSVSYLYDGNRLVQFPQGIFGAAIRQLKAR
jgi:putative peptidoglycan lipid II flippase